ncbi:hypothetical protein KPH14_005050 [Odynerus spinipes]|uniref:Dynactin subunit 4 n=1 Tax=Odynerus spinipes TaxID=1348599 RepID=A0AAD9RP67_9HYME|nr:hypothetical protein KPH14_005050 [Odynerus spinipes]
MAYLYQPDYVRYVCNCGSLKPISKIYFCRHCSKIRCGYCVCQEVDFHYCPNCMENLPSAEVRLKKNRCSSCFNCPNCFQMLSTRAGHAPLRTTKEGKDSKDAKVVPKKVYYLACSFCRWSSRDVGIPDQTMATGKWPEQENPHTRRINALIDYHKILTSKEKQQRERKKFQSKHSFMQFESCGLTSAMIRKRIGQSLKLQTQLQSSDQPAPSIATEDVEELSPEIFTEPIDIIKISTLEQRLKHPDVQAENVNELRPQRRQFLVKRSQRCRVCEHNLSKPNICTQSTKFKIQLAAFYHIPEVKIVTCEPLYPGKSSELFLKFCNPTQHPTQISLFPLNTSTAPVPATDVTEKGEHDDVETVCEAVNSLSSVIRQVPIIEEVKIVKVVSNADLTLPHSSLILPARDDAAEYDDTADTHNYQDDPKLVVWRKGNKAVVRLTVTPYENDEIKGEPVIVGFVMQHVYVNTITALEHKATQKLDLKVKLYLTLGKLCGTA